MTHIDFIILGRFRIVISILLCTAKIFVYFALQGLEIKLKDSALSTTVQHLASAVVEIAGHDFTLHGFGFGIELGRSSVYYHVSHGDVEAWVTDGSPMTRSDFQQFVSAGIERGRLMDSKETRI